MLKTLGCDKRSSLFVVSVRGGEEKFLTWTLAYTVPQTVAVERLNPARPIAITRRYKLVVWRYDTQQKDTQQNDIQPNKIN